MKRAKATPSDWMFWAFAVPSFLTCAGYWSFDTKGAALGALIGGILFGLFRPRQSIRQSIENSARTPDGSVPYWIWQMMAVAALIGFVFVAAFYY